MSFMYARIKPGVAHGAALAQLQTLEDRFRDSVAEPALRGHLITSGNKVSLDRVRAEQMKSIKSGLLLLQGGALMVLLLGCVNVSSLMLARSNARQMELALRQALGAGRGALARQLLSEAILLALAGGTLGLALTWTSLRLINTYTGMIVFGSPPIALEGYTLGLTLLGSLLVALLIGLLPVLRVWRATGMQAAIQSGTRGASRGSGIRAISSGLVIAQVALALILLCGAGLLVRSFAKVMAIDPGFDARKIIHARVAVDSSYKNSASVQATQSRILEKMREIPGVESVAYSAHNPVQRDSQPITLPLRGMGHGKDSTYPTAILLGVSPEFLPTLGIRLLEGRNFTEADLMPKARLVLVVDQRFAERYFPDQSAIGQLFAFGPDSQNPDSAPMIVGVAEAAKLRGLDDSTGVPYVYRPAALGMGGISLALRTTRTLGDMLPLIRAGVRDVDSALPVYEAATLQMHLDELGANRRGVMWLLGAFAGIALILVAVGIYGMLAYDVTQRIREIGIRGAIGATRGQIVTMILRQGLWKAGAGLIIGLIVTSFLSRYMGSLLFEVRPNDPAIFAGVAGLLLGVAFLASWLPARRAAKVDPIVALRYE